MTASAVAAPKEAARDGPGAAATRSAADLQESSEQVLTEVPRPVGEATVVPLDGRTLGGLAARQAEWGIDGGTVLLTGQVPFATLTGRAGFRSDGSLDGTVQMTATVGLFGLDLAEASWSVAAWTPEQSLAAPRVGLRGTTLAVDLAALPAEVAWTPRAGVEAPLAGRGARVHLPDGLAPPGEPLSPRVVEVYRGLLGVDPSGLQVHPDTAVAGAPAFVTDQHLFLAPGIYGVDSPAALGVLDAAIRAALTGLLGAVSGEPEPLVPPAPPSPGAPPADRDVVHADVPGGDPVAAAEQAATQTTEQPAEPAGEPAAGAATGPAADEGAAPGGPPAEGEPAEPAEPADRPSCC